jgi:hypothetical protein
MLAKGATGTPALAVESFEKSSHREYRLAHMNAWTKPLALPGGPLS